MREIKNHLVGTIFKPGAQGFYLMTRDSFDELTKEQGE